MTITSFFKLVELRTKVASVIPYAIGTLYAYYRFDNFILENFLLMLVSLLAIDMATTAINNWQDYIKAKIRHGYGYESHNAITAYAMDIRIVKAAIAILLIIAAAFGFLLYLMTDLTVLAVGVLSFIAAAAYSMGPLPISRTPFAELLSGGFMGYVIPFLAVYIQTVGNAPAFIALDGWRLVAEMDILESFYLLLVAMPAIAGIFNIMLANNICDMEEDLKNGRYTFPIMAGKRKALIVYRLLYASGFIAMIAALALGLIPPVCALALLTAAPVWKNIGKFMNKQTKAETFATAVMNFVLVNSSLAVTLALGIVLP